MLLGEAVRSSGARGGTDWTVQWAAAWQGRDEYGGGKREGAATMVIIGRTRPGQFG